MAVQEQKFVLGRPLELGYSGASYLNLPPKSDAVHIGREEVLFADQNQLVIDREFLDLRGGAEKELHKQFLKGFRVELDEEKKY